MRDLCNCHIHYFRGGGGPVVKRFEFQKVQMDVNKKYAFPDGETTRITIDKTYFGCYKSVADGAEHHFKFKPPKALFVLVIVVGVVGYLGYGVYERRIAAHEASIEPPAGVEAVMPQTAPQAASSADVAPVLTAQEYL
ncbi:zonular occludens toxin domain-containing protein, partial [Pseudomonas aeruginosa]